MRIYQNYQAGRHCKPCCWTRRDEPTPGLTLDTQTGKPSAMNEQYQHLLALREVYPENQIDVLNIYGDIGGETDGSVLNVSSKALRYLVVERAKKLP